MSTHINAHQLKDFIIKTIGADKLEKSQTIKFNIKDDEFETANLDENNYLELDEIIQDDDLYDKFATLFVEEQKKNAEEVDEEKAKEDEIKVKDKNGAGV